jgi:hypothetical protein
MTSTMKRFIIALLVLAVLVAYLGWKWVNRTGDTSVASQKTELEVTSPDLIKDFESNETIANKKYIGKVIGVSGTIAEIKENKTDISVYLKEPNGISGVSCSFSKDAIHQEGLKVGQNIRLKGICSGYLMDVVLNKCAIEK